MVSDQFRDDVSTVPGMAAVLFVCVAAGVVVINPRVTLILDFWKLVVSLWIVYLLYRLVVAVERFVDLQKPSE